MPSSRHWSGWERSLPRMRYEECRPHELDRIIRERPFAIIPWGAHEWHGPQNAVGLDTIKAHHMALDLCKEVGGVVLPPVYCGYQTMKPWKDFRHTLEFTRETVFGLALQYLNQLYDEGFLVMLVLMGHYGGKHVETLQEAVQRFNDCHSKARAVAWQDYVPAGWVNVRGGDHAGRNETSLLLHYRPDLVDLSQLPKEGEITVDIHGVGGEDPRKATAEHGKYLAELFVQQAAPKVREMIAEVLRLKDKAKGQV
ncbi:MAG: creatininase family protein [Planctomycetes bacterium]|nr:creatininase family protein [Planctomycetota bacterium]